MINNITTTIACVETKGPTKAGMFSHFGMDVETKQDVDAAYETVKSLQDEISSSQRCQYERGCGVFRSPAGQTGY